MTPCPANSYEQGFRSRGKLDDAVTLNVCREIQDLVRGLIVLRERERSSLRIIGAKVDTALASIFAWISRDKACGGQAGGEENDDGEMEALDSEDERRLRLSALALSLAALEAVKPPNRMPVGSRGAAGPSQQQQNQGPGSPKTFVSVMAPPSEGPASPLLT